MDGSVTGRAQTINQLVEYAWRVTAVFWRVPGALTSEIYLTFSISYEYDIVLDSVPGGF
tara:strand:+ start:4881 stop:5057 length:177 start_codon:yes stop_codon:yes gene_type:complete